LLLQQKTPSHGHFKENLLKSNLCVNQAHISAKTQHTRSKQFMSFGDESVSKFNTLSSSERRVAMSKQATDELKEFMKERNAVSRLHNIQGDAGYLFIREDRRARLFWRGGDYARTLDKKEIQSILKENPDLLPSLLMLTDYFDEVQNDEKN
jgi:hypothetical protein